MSTVSRCQATGRPPALTGNEHPNLVPYAIFPTRTDNIFIGVGNDATFKKLAREIGGGALGVGAVLELLAAQVRQRALGVQHVQQTGRALAKAGPRDGQRLFGLFQEAGLEYDQLILRATAHAVPLNAYWQGDLTGVLTGIWTAAQSNSSNRTNWSDSARMA